MPLHVLIVPDKFKGTLTARQAAMAIARGWTEVRPDDHIDQLPMADGGDGFAEVLGQLLEAEKMTCHTVDAAGRPRAAEWWYARGTGTAIVEAAQVNGLSLFSAGQYHPFQLDTFGLGAVLRAAKEAGARRLYVGIGGSATNDGGFGLARAFGWRFWTAGGKEILTWSDLERLARVEAPLAPLGFAELIIAVDVSNPLLGSEGASRIYGPQKGLQEVDISKAERCLGRLAEVMQNLQNKDYARHPGAGAAGGLGFGLKAFCGGEFRSGAEVFAEVSRLEARMQTADLVITAEGSMDAQTLMGKGVGLIAAMAARAGKPCLCLAGSVSVDPGSMPWPGFQSFAIIPLIAPRPEALAQPEECLWRLASHAARAFRRLRLGSGPG